MKSKKANLTLYIVFAFVSILILLIASVISPLGIRMSTETFILGERMLDQSYDRLNSINDSAVKSEIMSNINAARMSSSDNIEIFSKIYQYAWFIILIITALILFLISRSLVETQPRIA